MTKQPEPGDRVRVRWGRWANRVGVLQEWRPITSGGTIYTHHAVVLLDPTPRGACERTVAVKVVEPE